MHDYEELEDKARVERVLELRRHLSDLMILFRQAAAWLQPFDKIWADFGSSYGFQQNMIEVIL